MNTLGVRVAQWNMESHEGKAILMGSRSWIKKTLNDAYGYLLLHHVEGVHFDGPHEIYLHLIRYQNFIAGVEVIGDGTDFDRMTGWICRRGLFVLEKAVYPLTDSRYLDVLEGLDVGASTTFWCD